MRSLDFYAIIGPSKCWYKSPRLVRAASAKRSPNLKPKEIAVLLKIQLPDDWDVPYTIPITVTDQQIQRPTAKAI